MPKRDAKRKAQAAKESASLKQCWKKDQQLARRVVGKSPQRNNPPVKAADVGRTDTSNFLSYLKCASAAKEERVRSQAAAVLQDYKSMTVTAKKELITNFLNLVARGQVFFHATAR